MPTVHIVTHISSGDRKTYVFGEKSDCLKFAAKIIIKCVEEYNIDSWYKNGILLDFYSTTDEEVAVKKASETLFTVLEGAEDISFQLNLDVMYGVSEPPYESLTENNNNIVNLS